MRTVEINGRTWAVGLDWQPFVRSVTAEAVLRAAKSSMDASGDTPDMVCVHRSQYGFGYAKGELRRFNQVRSLGAGLHIPYRSFLGCFRFPGRDGAVFWWVFARVNGENIGGFSDAYYDSEKDADGAIRALKSLSPEPFEEEYRAKEIDEGIRYLEPLLSIPIRSYFSGDGKIFPLNRFVRRKRLLTAKVAALAAIGAVGWLASSSIGEYVSEFEFTEKSQKAKARIEEQRRRFEKYPEELFSQEWKSVPGMDAVISPCIREILGAPVSISGWLFESAECKRQKNGVKVIKVYGHTSATRFDPLPSSANVDPKSPKIMRDAASAGISFPAAWKDVSWRDLPTETSVRTLLLQIAQTAEVKATVNIRGREKKTIPDVGVITCPWAVGTWILDSVPQNTLFDGLTDVLANVAGISIDSIECGRSALWKVTGKVYVR